MKGNPWKPCRSGTGAALVIVLAFIVLIAALMVIFFTQAISYRNQGNSSFNNFKSTALAQSGLETVVGDLEQEIANGSPGTQTVSYGLGTNVYYVTNNAYAVPQRQAIIPASIPNLIRISQRSDTIPFPGVVSRASADSTTNAAASGQLISPARWNQHYLIPRQNAGSTTIDTTPTNAFSAPDWVYVSSSGPTVITAPSTKVIGRYAYAIYDEGGLLDANVAGFPSNTSTNSTYASSVGPSAYNTNGYGGSYPVWGSGLKGTEAFADLTVPIPIGSGTSPMFTQSQIDQLVGWRNNATAQPTGTYNSYTFSQTQAMTYHDWMVNATNGYLTTSGNSYNNSTGTYTDQVFASRQALIAFANATNPPMISQDALQYLGTFTRALEQPCYNPPVGRPMVQDSTSANTAPFGTGNDAHGVDRYSSTNPTTNSPTDINPPFLSVRVGTGGWLRADGTTALAGEPLLKKRFPLSRLSLFPTNRAAPSAAAATLIYNYFGLKQDATTGFWTYNHGSPSTEPIYKLSEVAALPASSAREPDFFELLRAAINVGSLGKGAGYQGNSSVTYWTQSPSASYLQQFRDTQAQLQILQIGANIIDQAKADDYPTQIAFLTTPSTVVRGVEDLPYLYRVHNWIMRTGTTGALGEILFQPELWNPHSPSSSANVLKTSMPSSFQVRLTMDPASAANTQPYTFGASYSKGSTVVTADLSPFCVFTSGGVGGSLPGPITFNAGAANTYWDFREPTMLAQVGKPGGTTPANTATGDPTFSDYPAYTPDSGRKMLGFTVVRDFPYINGTVSLYKIDTSENGNNSAVRYYLDYLDPTGVWRTYDEEPFQPFDGITLQTQVPNVSAGINVSNTVDLQSWSRGSGASQVATGDFGGGGRTDPRTGRWAFYNGNFFGFIPPVLTGPSADPSGNTSDPVVWGSYRPNSGVSYGDHIGGRYDKGFVYANSYASPNYGYVGFQHGDWTENTYKPTYQTDTPGDAGLRYNLDPDGIPRRAVGGYVMDSSNGGVTGPSTQPAAAGLPMIQDNYSSRPTMLHRPFRSVAELGYVFRDSPWGDINFTFPESGDSALLDVFCINETSDPNGLVAGRTNLNTRQAPVIAALLSGTLRDKDDPTNPVLTAQNAVDIASALASRTGATAPTAAYGPLMSRADLVGTWIGPSTPALSATALSTAASAKTIDLTKFYSGFSYDIGTSAVQSVNATSNLALIPRQRNSVMRALTDVGTTRTWNLMIDLVAQSGQFPASATGFSNFVVEGEKHYWLHVAIDRYTGKVIDSQLEVVSE